MKVLSISSDRRIFEKDSAVRARALVQASLVDRLVVIVFTKEDGSCEEFKIGNLRVIPTNSPYKIFFIIDAYRLGKDIEWVDIITTQDPFETGFAGLFLKWKKKAKLQIQIHTDIESPFFRKSSILNFIRFLVSRFTLFFSDGVRVVSQRIKTSLDKSFKNKLDIEVLPVFTLLERPKEGVFIDLHKKYPQFDFFILTSARLEKEKKIETLLKIFKEALFYIKGAGLIVVGDGSRKKTLEKLAKELGIEKSVKFIGWQKNMIGFYQSADLYVSTSLYEGYGLSLLEAGFYGLPIVSTDVGIMGEVYKDNEGALICPVQDMECMLRKIVEIRKFKDVRERIANGAKTSARANIWGQENHNNKFLKLWKKLV